MYDLSRRNKPDMIYLMETKNQDYYCEKVKRKFKLEKGCYVEPNGLSRGLALWWKKDIDVTIYHNEESMIDTTINLSRGDRVIHITWIYGSTNWEGRLGLWEKMRNINQTRTDLECV